MSEFVFVCMVGRMHTRLRCCSGAICVASQVGQQQDIAFYMQVFYIQQLRYKVKCECEWLRLLQDDETEDATKQQALLAASAVNNVDKACRLCAYQLAAKTVQPLPHHPIKICLFIVVFEPYTLN